MNNKPLLKYLSALVIALSGCVAENNNTTGGKTNWLEACGSNSDCADLDDAICADQLCTRACERDEACADVGNALRCEAVSSSSTQRACLPGPEPEQDGGSMFDETHAVYDGSLTVSCVAGDEQLAGSYEVQVELSREGTALTGQIWGLPALDMKPLAGTIGEAGTAFDSVDISWPNYEGSGLQLTAIDLSAEQLVAAVEGHLEGGPGDIIMQCDVIGELAATRDHVAPSVAIAPSERVAGFAPLTLSFDEPVLGDVEVVVRNGTAQVEVELAPMAVGDGFIDGLTLTPVRAWPGGTLSVEVVSPRDVAGNPAAIPASEISVPALTSATSNPSFEAETVDDGPWFGCQIADQVTYTDWGNGEQEFSIAPSAGDKLAVCPGNGLLLQAYIALPKDASRLLIDAGNVDYSLGEVFGTLELSLKCDTEVIALTPDADTTDQLVPTLWTYSVAVNPELQGCWLQLRYDGGIYEEGSPSGAAFFDNLRFE